WWSTSRSGCPLWPPVGTGCRCPGSRSPWWPPVCREALSAPLTAALRLRSSRSTLHGVNCPQGQLPSGSTRLRVHSPQVQSLQGPLSPRSTVLR
ncbi:hypothetical protein NDU88_007415, partial [Pleurodeles waltl]